MKIFLLSFTLTLVFTLAQGQKMNSKTTYDYLTLFERWKLIVSSDNSFVLTTNAIFRPDTSITASGTFSRLDSSIKFYCNTLKLEYNTLLNGDYNNQEIIAQSRAFKAFKGIINFKNALRRVYNTSIFSNDITATYYRGDGKWTCIITLLIDKTYIVSESVHGHVEHSEKGQ